MRCGVIRRALLFFEPLQGGQSVLLNSTVSQRIMGIHIVSVLQSVRVPIVTCIRWLIGCRTRSIHSIIRTKRCTYRRVETRFRHNCTIQRSRTHCGTMQCSALQYITI